MADNEWLNMMDADSHDWNERHRQAVHARWEAGELTRSSTTG